MRLIDADELNIDFYDEYETEDDAFVCRYVSEYQIDSAPTIDAVRIVRCEECKHKRQCHKAVELTTHEITSVTIAYRPIEFCSYGEREGE